MNPYAVLGLEFGASQQDIKNKYRQLAVKYHPDKSPHTAEKFLEIKRAYELLTREGGDLEGFTFSNEYRRPTTFKDLVKWNLVALCNHFLIPGLHRSLTQLCVTKLKLPSDYSHPPIFSIPKIVQFLNPFVLGNSVMTDLFNIFIPHFIHTKLYRVWGYLPPNPPLPFLVRILGDILSTIALFPFQLLEREISHRVLHNQEIHMGDMFNFPRILVELSKREVAGKTFLASLLGALVLQLSRRAMDHFTAFIMSKIGSNIEDCRDKKKPFLMALVVFGTFFIRFVIPLALACPFEVVAYRLQSNAMMVGSGESFFQLISRPIRERGFREVLRGTLIDIYKYLYCQRGER